MKNILFFVGRRNDPFVKKLGGIYERASTYGWRVFEIRLDSSPHRIEEYLARWKPDGCLIDYSQLESPPPPKSFAGVPTVFIDADPSVLPRNSMLVSIDTRSLVEVAAAELLSLGVGHFAYVGYRLDCQWSRERYEMLSLILSRHGAPCARHPEGWASDNPLTAQRKIATWLKRLPKPCGLLATNDETAETVMTACSIAGIRIPEDIALVSVDNDLFVCENTIPTLTSIRPDFMQCGRIAADLLQRRMTESHHARERLFYGSFITIRRQSSLVCKTSDPAVAKAAESIRLNACRGISAEDAVKIIGGGRRTAEKRFREAMGTSIYEAILQTRMNQVFALLRNPHQTIEPIANMCGWSSSAHLKRLFKQRTGMTMREWRAREQQT